MIRILHYGISPNMGGIESFIMNLYRNIDRNKVQFDFVKMCSKIAFEDEIESLGGKIHYITPRSKNPLKNYRELDMLFKNNDYKIIHVHLNTLSYIAPIIIGKRNGLKVIIHSHNEWNGSNYMTNVLHHINKQKIKHMKYTALACSDVAGKYMFNRDYTIVKNGIELDKFIYSETKRLEIREELNIKSNEFLIGHIGRFDIQKNHEFLIDIIKDINNSINSFKVCLVGSGILEDTIKLKVKENNLEDKVIFLGVRNDIDKIMMAFDYFILPSLFEGLPFVLVEAQTSGLNCLVSDKVSKESDMGVDLFNQIPLNDIGAWSRNIIDYYNTDDNNRIFDIEKIIQKGYDINQTTEFLIDLYLKSKI